MAGEDSNTSRFPDPRDQLRDQVPDQSREHIREHVLQRTLFGGMSFGARLTSLISLGLSAIAATGVDFISVGAITQSAPAVDIGLDLADD